jgi:hypothetical protein
VLIASNSITISSSGQVHANGEGRVNAGGGSGGGILLQAPSITNEGSIQATGGGLGESSEGSGGGGGGRIKLYYSAGGYSGVSLDPTINTKGGVTKLSCQGSGSWGDDGSVDMDPSL